MMRAEIISLLLQNLSDIFGSKLYCGISVSLPLTLGCQIQWSGRPKKGKKKPSYSKGRNEMFPFSVLTSFAPDCSILKHVKKTALQGPVHDTKINPDLLRIPQQFTGDLSAI